MIGVAARQLRAIDDDPHAQWLLDTLRVNHPSGDPIDPDPINETLEHTRTLPHKAPMRRGGSAMIPLSLSTESGRGVIIRVPPTTKRKPHDWCSNLELTPV